MNGSLSQRSPIDILAEVLRRRASGILRFRSQALVRQVFLDAGSMIRFAASNVPDESIAVLFRERAGTTDEHLRQANAAKQGQELLGTTLVRLGLLDRARLLEITLEHVRRVVRGILAMREGDWDFQQGALPFREQLDGGVGTVETLLEWARRVPDGAWIRRRLGADETRVVLAARPPEGYQQIKVSPAEGFVLSRVEGGATIREICLLSPMEEEATLRALFGLALAGILDIPTASPASPEQPTGPAAPRPEPAARAAASPAGPSAAPRPQPAAPQPAPSTAPQPAPSAGPAAAASSTGQEAGPAAAAGDRPVGSYAFASPAPQPKNGGAPPPKNGGAPARPVAPGRPAGPRPAAIRRPPPPRKAPTPARPFSDDALETEVLRRFEQMRDQDLYQVLGVLAASTVTEIRRAYYGLAKQFHPDKFSREDLKAKAEKVFAHITEAYATLSGEETRKRYEEDLEIRRSPKPQEKAADGHELARLNFKHGKDQFEKGRFGESIAFFQNACDQDPAKAEHFHYLALAQSRNPRWKKDAEENFFKALQLDPSNADTYAHLGTLYARGGLHSKARDMFRKALEWDPSQEEALAGLAGEEGEKKGILGMFKK